MLTKGHRLVRRLAALADVQQKVAILAEEAERLGAVPFAELLSEIVARAARSKSEFDHGAMLAVAQYLTSSFVDDELKARLLEASRDGGHRQLMQILLSPPSHRENGVPRIPDYGSGRLLTLGERKSLARKPSRQILERVMADPHPSVIANLLRNPRLTEDDVLRIVTKRPNHGEVLTEVHKHPRWMKRYRIRHALVRNPYTPPGVALKLLPMMLRQDLRELLEAKELHPALLMVGRQLLEGVDGDEPEGEEEDQESPEEPLLH